MCAQVDSKERIIQAAASLFYEHGFESVGLQKICTQASVSKSSFYHFFASKDDLAVAVINALWQQGQESIAVLLASDGSSVQKIRIFFEPMLSNSGKYCNGQGNFLGCPFGNLASELSVSNATLRCLVQDIFDHLAQVFQTLLEKAKREHEVPTTLDPKHAAHALLILMQGISVTGKVYNGEEIIYQSGQYTLDLILGTSPHST